MTSSPSTYSSPPPPPPPPPPKDVTIKISGHDSPNINTATVTSRNSDGIANRMSGQQTPPDVRVSFSSEPVAVNRMSSGETEEVVLLCSSNNSFRRKPASLIRSKTKSRLLDPPEESNSKCQAPRMVKSEVLLGLGGTSEMDEDDPFLEEDLPEDYKKTKFSALSIVQLVSLFLIIGALVGSLTINVLKRRKVFGLEMWKWEILVLVLICGRLVSGLVIRIVVFFIERNFLLRKRVLYFVYGLRNAVQNCVWLALVLIAWQCIFDEKVERVTHGKILPYVTKVWVCLLCGTLIWLLKSLLIKVLASSFHVTAFFDRIQESLFSQYVIEKLSGPPSVEIQREIEEEERVMVEIMEYEKADLKAKANMFPKSGRVIEPPRRSTASDPAFSRVTSKKDEMNGITIDQLHRLNQKNISAWNMKRLMNIVRRGMISNLDEKLEGSNGEDQITTENQAIAAAGNIFLNVSKTGSKFIHQQDLLRFMREDEVSRTMRLFDCVDNQNGISKRALKNWVVNAFRERRALALSLNDTKTAVDKLHQMLNVLVGVLIVIIWLLILRVATTHFFIFLSSQLLVVVFMFGNTCKTTFEAIIFLFVMHPFDVGDRVEVEGVQMVVEEMNILTTVFLKYDNHKIYYPNSVLSTKPIYNYYRSPDMGDGIDFSVSVSTPVEKIATMKERIISYCNNRCDHWYPDPMIVLREVEDMNKLTWSVWLTHKLNFQDMGERWLRRSLLVEEMVTIFRELDIQYRLLPRDVNVRNMPPITSDRFPSNWTTLGASASAKT